jgi:hypothetical protein
MGVETDHGAVAPRDAMALFISSIEAALLAAPNMPFNSVTERLVAIHDRP